MEGKAMLAEQEARAFSGESLPVGEPVTLVIEEERFFGWVASASPAHSLACVSIEFTTDLPLKKALEFPILSNISNS
jgi:hypothetical protein